MVRFYPAKRRKTSSTHFGADYKRLLRIWFYASEVYVDEAACFVDCDVWQRTERPARGGKRMFYESAAAAAAAAFGLR